MSLMSQKFCLEDLLATVIAGDLDELAFKQFMSTLDEFMIGELVVTFGVHTSEADLS